MEEEHFYRQQQLQEIWNCNVALRANIDQEGLDYGSQEDNIIYSDDFNLLVHNSTSIAGICAVGIQLTVTLPNIYQIQFDPPLP